MYPHTGTVSSQMPATLPFTTSSSQVVGMHGQTMDCIREHAPRIVGLSKVTADALSLGASSLMGKTGFSVGMVMSLVSRFILIADGGKRDADDPEEIQKPLMQGKSWEARVVNDAGKILHPLEYPVEAASAWAMMSGMALAASGLSMKEGRTQSLLIGSIIAAAEGGVLFGGHKAKTGTGESLRFAHSSSQPQGLTGTCGKVLDALHDRPEVRSGILQAGTSLLTISLGASWLKQNRIAGHMMMAAGALYFGANMLYSACVRKGHQPQQSSGDEQGSASFVQRVQEQGGNNGPAGRGHG
jgi:hypothetical protein